MIVKHCLLHSWCIYATKLNTQCTYSLAAAIPIYVNFKFQIKTRACSILFKEQHACTELTEFQLKKWYQCLSGEFLPAIKPFHVHVSSQKVAVVL